MNELIISTRPKNSKKMGGPCFSTSYWNGKGKGGYLGFWGGGLLSVERGIYFFENNYCYASVSLMQQRTACAWVMFPLRFPLASWLPLASLGGWIIVPFFLGFTFQLFQCHQVLGFPTLPSSSIWDYFTWNIFKVKVYYIKYCCHVWFNKEKLISKT